MIRIDILNRCSRTLTIELMGYVELRSYQGTGSQKRF